MFAKYRSFCTSLALIIAFAFWGALIAYPAHAQEPTPPHDPGCYACHEDLYRLHDTGKSFCLCQESMRCTCCHGGDPQSYKKEEAHAGIVLYPTRSNATACQKCHPDDYQQRVEHFIAVAGVSEVQPVVPTLTPQAQAAKVSPAPFFPPRLREPWRMVGLVLIGIAMCCLIYFGYFCWKTDCMRRSGQ
jgi:hypothetical protein